MNYKRSGKTVITGVCGRSGSGKSTVVRHLKALGCKCIDADKCAAKAVKKGSPCLKEIRDAFGESVICENGELNRKALSDVIFGSDEKRLILNGITLKYIIDLMHRKKEKYINKGFEFIIYDAPLLFESGLDKECDHIICVTCDTEKCVKRLTKRDGISEESAANRLKAQLSDEYLISRSDINIRNDGTAKELKEKTKAAFELINKGTDLL